MNATTAAGLFARGGAIMGLIAAIAGIFHWQLSDEDQTAISEIAGGLIIILYPLYETARAKSIAHKQQLVQTLDAHNIPIPQPAKQDIKP